MRQSRLLLSGALLSVAFIGCGGRTEVLDPNAVGIDVNSSQPSDGSNGGAPSSSTGSGASSSAPAGSVVPPHSVPPSSGSAGAGGSASSPGTGGAAGATGVAGSPSSVPAICSNYCGTAAKSSCPGVLPPLGECLSSCNAELSAQTAQCQQAAAGLVDCFLSVFAAANGQCSGVLERAVSSCQRELLTYNGCARQVTPPDPSPTPIPIPTPIPTPARMCGGGGGGDQASCTRSVKCSDGTYYGVTCTRVGPEQSACSCSSNNGFVGSFGLNESTLFACNDALISCGGGIPLP